MMSSGCVSAARRTNEDDQIEQAEPGLFRLRQRSAGGLRQAANPLANLRR